MSFYVYENWQAEGHKAIVHRAQCSYCNNGRGIHPGASDRHGRWHGPFDSVQEALAAARRTGADDVRSCRRKEKCNPSV